MSDLAGIDERIASSLERIATALEARHLKTNADRDRDGCQYAGAYPHMHFGSVPPVVVRHGSDAAPDLIIDQTTTPSRSVPFKWRCEKCSMWVMENEVHGCSVS